MKKILFIFIPVLFIWTSCEDSLEIEGYKCPEKVIIPDYNAMITDGCEKACDIDLLQVENESFWDNLGTNILKSVAGGIISAGTKTGVNKALDYFFGDEKTEILNKVVGQFNKINAQMGQLLNLSEETLKILDEDRYNRLKTEFVDYKAELFAAANVNNGFISRIKENITDEELKALIKEWGNTPVNGNVAKIELNNLLNRLFSFSYMYGGKHRNLFAVYDMIVFQNTPWEKYGYDIRDAFRAYTAAVLAQTFYLTSIYYHYLDRSGESQKELKKSADLAIEYCEKHGNKVERRDDAVCQIRGARVIIKKLVKADDFWPHSLYDYPFPANQLDSSAIRAIVNFYRNQGMGDNFTVIDCLNEGDLNLSKENDPKIVLKQTEYKVWEFYPGKQSSVATLKFTNFAKDDPIKSYSGAKKELYPVTSINNYYYYHMTENFIVAPDGVITYDDFD